MIRVLIADDQELIRQSLQIVLGDVENLEITDTVEDGIQALESITKRMPDVILMDIRMPKMDGIQCTRIVKEKYPSIKIIILTTFDDEEYVFEALRDGASGYLLKGISIDRLVDAIYKVYEGNAMINSDIVSKVVHLFFKMAQTNLAVQVKKEGVDDLGSTERKIIHLIGCGLSTKEISEKLFLTQGTVRNYLSAILNKLRLRDRTQLAIWAVQTGLVSENLNDNEKE